ncbi:MAG: hypothetical protein ORN49_08075 [Rhodobacteraceae bacterium]|nr:hypothetical protein [Paracoccaceae bacterium]
MFPSATFPLGSCNVSIELDDTSGTAKVILMAASFEAPGGAVYDNFHVDSSTNGSISPASLQACGLTSVSGLTQDGADATFATDNYVGFSFQAVDSTLATNQYEFALSGALNSRQEFGPFWTAFSASWSDMGTSESRYALATLGTQMQIGETTALGALLELDRASFRDGAATSEGKGWLVGPYLTTYLPNSFMQLQARALWGRTQSDLSPDGTYTDAVDSRRSLVMFDLSGPLPAGPTTITPHIGANYSSETSGAYTDSQNQAIPSVKTAISQGTLGVNVTRAIGGPSGGLTVTWGLDGVWTSTVSGPAVDYDGGRARASFGLSKVFDNGGTLGFGMFYDGLGDDKTHTTGASLNLALKF